MVLEFIFSEVQKGPFRYIYGNTFSLSVSLVLIIVIVSD